MNGEGWLGRLAAGLRRSSARLSDGIGGIFAGRRLDDAAVQELEDLLVAADLGAAAAARLAGAFARGRFDREINPQEVREALAADIARALEPFAKPLDIDPAHRPHVALVVGVNGSGKTTTIGKLAQHYRAAGRSVMLAAGDTFRAAGVSQLEAWGERTGCPVIARPTGADAAGLAFDALCEAKTQETDLLIVDTAGRLHNRSDLMAELGKIVRSLAKIDGDAPHSRLLVLDATTGQNAHAQVEMFRERAGITGLVVTKLDGTAKGGVLVALAERFALPVHAVGVGENADDLRPFDARDFARSLMGLAG